MELVLRFCWDSFGGLWGPSWAVLGHIWTIWGSLGRSGAFLAIRRPSRGCVGAVGRGPIPRLARPLASSVLFSSASVFLPPSDPLQKTYQTVLGIRPRLHMPGVTVFTP